MLQNTMTCFVTLKQCDKITVITFHQVEMTDDVFDDYVDLYKSLFSIHNSLYIIFDASQLTHLPFYFVLKQILLMETMKECHKKYLKAYSIVIQSNIIRNLLFFAYEIRPPVCKKNSISNNYREAIEFINQYVL